MFFYIKLVDRLPNYPNFRTNADFRDKLILKFGSTIQYKNENLELLIQYSSQNHAAYQSAKFNFEKPLLIHNSCIAEILWDEILHRVPMLEHAEIREMINGPESFTPDSAQLLGPVPQVGLNHSHLMSPVPQVSLNHSNLLGSVHKCVNHSHLLSPVPQVSLNH